MNDKIRADFPLVSKYIYLDNACMSLKPIQVLEKMSDYYKNYSGCSGRSAHQVAMTVTHEVADARKKVRKFIGANKDEEIIFTKNATESINLVAKSFKFRKNDLVLTGSKEHNSNLLPWINLKNYGIRHKVIQYNKDNTFSMENFEKALSENPRLVALGHCSNLDGVEIPAKEIIKKAHKSGAIVLLDAAQSVPHTGIDVSSLDADFVAFSGHKMLGPTGLGVLYGKKKLLTEMNPFILGGSTVKDSTYESFSIEDLPEKFEAGLQNYGSIIGFGAAIEYLEKIGLSRIKRHVISLNKIATTGLRDIFGDKIRIIGPEDAEKRNSILSFYFENLDSHTIALVLDQHKILVRSGAHCVHSWFNANNIKGSVRASFYLYNIEEEVSKFLDAMRKVKGLVK
jgi:cysteine desulfurase/selenocysteine lyase